MNAFRHTRKIPLLTILGAALALCAADGARAADPAYAWGCSYRGSTLAEGGSPSDLLSNAKAQVGGCGGDMIESHGTVYGSRWTGDAYFDYSFAQGARSSANASAGLGVLHASSYTSATSTPMRYTYFDNAGNPVAIDNEYRAYGESYASSYWYDEITVNSGPVYGRVVLKFSLTLSGSESVTPGSAGSADIFARFIIDDDRSSWDRTLSLSEAGSTFDTAGYWPGTVIRIYGDLSAMTNVRAGGKYLDPWGFWRTGLYIPSAEASADASNTAGFQVEVLTEGASYTSASGRSYVALVPEPDSVWLLGLGAMLVLGLARRQR